MVNARFRKANPCPVCGGYDDMPRGKGLRCDGWLSDDREYAHCAREQCAGRLKPDKNGRTYAHRLVGDCKCGVRHDPNPEPLPSQRGQQIGPIYRYTDAHGQVLYEVVRYTNPKGFKQRRPDGKGGWIWNLKGVPPVLYQLPEVLEAIATDKPICIPEGEEDVEALRRHGYTATCNSGGAKKWLDVHSQALEGATDVVLFGDHDAPGRAHVAQVNQSLRRVGLMPRIARMDGLPEHGDIRDWLKTHGQEDLDRLIAEAQPLDVESAPERAFPRVEAITYTLQDLQHKQIPDIQWTVEDVLPEGLAFIAGPPGLGKSMLLLQIALAVSLGGKVLEMWPAVRGDVLYIATEDNERRMRDRVAQLTVDDPWGHVAWPEGFLVCHEIQAFDAGLVEQLEEWLRDHAQARLVIIDIFADVRPPRTPHSDWYQDERRMGKALDALAMRHHVCVLVSLHTNRLQHAEDPIDRVHGGSGLPGAAPTKTVLLPAQGFDQAIWHTRGRDTPREQHALTMVEGVWTYSGDGKIAQLTEERQAVLRYFALYPGFHSPQELADALGKSSISIRLLLRKLCDERLLRKVGYGKYQRQ